MGSWKLLLPWPALSSQQACQSLKPACTVVEATVRSALDAGCRVILVGGWRCAELAPLFASFEKVVLVENINWKDGMLGSIQCGIKMAAPGAPFVTIPADMPLVGPDTYSRLFAAVLERERAGLPPLPLFSACKGELGHPVFVPAGLRAEIAALGRGEKLRPFLLRAGGYAVEVGTDAVLADLDSPAEYEAAVRRFAAQTAPAAASPAQNADALPHTCNNDIYKEGEA